MNEFQNYSVLKSSPKQQPIEPLQCYKCGNKHLGEICAAKPISFIWKGDHKEVYIVGDWTQWQYHETLKKIQQGLFGITKNLSAGTYEYKYIVDGKWTSDNNESLTYDNFGGFNNIITIDPVGATIDTATSDSGDHYHLISSSIPVKQLRIMGSWDGWLVSQHMILSPNHLKNQNQFRIYKKLEPGKKYQFKFIIDHKFVTDPSYPILKNSFGQFNNWIKVSSDLMGNESSSAKASPCHTSSYFNPTCKFSNYSAFTWTKQPLQDFIYYNIYGHKISVVGDYLYVVGGIDKGCFKNLILKISLDTFICEQVLAFDWDEFSPRAFHHVKVYGNKLLIFGGIGDNVILQDYSTYNTPTNSFSLQSHIKGKPPCKREKDSCVLFKDMLIFFGGYMWTQDLQLQMIYNDVSILDVHYMKWIQVEQPEGVKPQPRYAHSATLYNQNMYVFGGVINSTLLLSTNDVWKLKLISHQKICWQEIKTLGVAPCPRYGHTSNIVREYIIIFGGMGQKGMLNDVFLLNMKQYKWIKPDIGGDFPKPRYFHHAAVLNQDEIIVLGGKVEKGFKNENAYILKTHLQGNFLDF